MLVLVSDLRSCVSLSLEFILYGFAAQINLIAECMYHVSIRGFPMINTITRTLFAGLLAVSGLSFLVPGIGTGQASETTQTTMGQTLPALDTAAPTDFETASFGLG